MTDEKKRNNFEERSEKKDMWEKKRAYARRHGGGGGVGLVGGGGWGICRWNFVTKSGSKACSCKTVKPRINTKKTKIRSGGGKR